MIVMYVKKIDSFNMVSSFSLVGGYGFESSHRLFEIFLID